MKRIIFSVLAVLFAALLYADARYYAWSYHYAVLDPGETELEIYTRLTQPDINNPSAAAWKRQVELEAGLIEKLDVSVYVVDSFASGVSKFDELKLRLRYKLTDKAADFVIDPILYAEYIYKADRTKSDATEFKAILAKDMLGFNAAVNITAKVLNKNWLRGSNWELGYSAGLSYAFLDGMLRLGAEFKGDWNSGVHMAGPVLAGERGNVWFTISPLFNIGTKGDDVSVQCIVGLMFK